MMLENIRYGIVRDGEELSSIFTKDMRGEMMELRHEGETHRFIQEVRWSWDNILWDGGKNVRVFLDGTNGSEIERLEVKACHLTGWTPLRTGDKVYFDSLGNLNLIGRDGK